MTLILGNEETVVLPCDYCASGYEAPVGFTMEYERISKVELLKITGKNVSEIDDVRNCDYRIGQYTYYPADLFDNKEDAEKELVKKIDLYDKYQMDCISSKKRYVNEQYSYKAGYHRKIAAKAEKDMKYHQEKCKNLKTKVKE